MATAIQSIQFASAFLDETKLFSKVSELYEAKKDSIHIIQGLSKILTGKTAVQSEFSRIRTT